MDGFRQRGQFPFACTVSGSVDGFRQRGRFPLAWTVSLASTASVSMDGFVGMFFKKMDLSVRLLEKMAS